MKNEKKRFAQQILRAGGALALFFGVFIGPKVAEPYQTSRKIRKEIKNDRIGLVRDTIDVTELPDMSRQITVGEYNIFSDNATNRYFRDLTGTAIGKEWTNNINYLSAINDYHEVRHAMNYRIMQHYSSYLAPEVFTADEISACVAASLAQMGGMPRLEPGKISPYMSYTLDKKADMHKVADMVLDEALSALYADTGTQRYYRSVFASQSNILADRMPKSPMINGEKLIQEMMTFEINGRRRNILKLASPEMRDAVYYCLLTYNER